MDGDQVEELISLEEYKIGDEDWRGGILDIFTIKDGHPTWLIAGAYRGTVDIFEDGIIRYLGHGGAHYYTYYFYMIQDGGLSLVMTAKSGSRGVLCKRGSVYIHRISTRDRSVCPILAFDLERLYMIEL